jgi:hypothetical protein
MSPNNDAFVGSATRARSAHVRNALLLLVVLGVGFMGGSLDRVSRTEQQPLQRSNTAVERVADQYFSAVNLLLETGDSAQLAQVLDDHFIGYVTGTETTMGKTDLIDQLRLLRSVAPDARMQFAIASTSESAFAADVAYTGVIPESFGGFVLAPAIGQAASELLTLRNGKIAERRGTSFAPLPFRQAATATIEVDPDRLTDASLRRWSLAPRSTVNGAFPYPLVIVASSEAFELEISPEQFEAALPGQPGIIMDEGQNVLTRSHTPAQIHEGGAVILPAGTPFSLRNTHDRELQLNVVELVGKPEDSKPPTFLEGLTSTLLARGATVDRGNKQLTVTVARLELEPGAHWLGSRVPGGSELVAVQSGSIDVQAAPGTVWTIDGEGQSVGQTASVRVDGKDGAAIDQALVVTYLAKGQDAADLWVVALSPAS